jgi:3-oxoacyl-[acyl-carrier-protein] synthase-1
LPLLTRLGLEDLQKLLLEIGVDAAPLVLGLPADLSEDEQSALRQELYGSSMLHPQSTWLPYGRASTFAALAAAMEMIAEGRSAIVVVGGIDSLCAPETVSPLIYAGRVLGPHTEGTIPGEAAAFAVLCRTDHPAADRATSVSLEGVARTRAATPFTKADRVTSDALAAAFSWFLGRGAQRVGRVVAAHSGEGYFGRSFSHAYLRAVDLMPEPLTVELIADRVGDVGAAAGIVGLALGMYRMVTDLPQAQHRTLVYSESDTGEVGAAIIEGRPTRWERSAAA